MSNSNSKVECEVCGKTIHRLESLVFSSKKCTHWSEEKKPKILKISQSQVSQKTNSFYHTHKVLPYTQVKSLLSTFFAEIINNFFWFTYFCELLHSFETWNIYRMTYFTNLAAFFAYNAPEISGRYAPGTDPTGILTDVQKAASLGGILL